MYRIYLDTNVFTLLRHDSSYAQVAQRLLSRKDTLLFFFSPAHLDDLSRDSSDQKYEDLQFMHGLVEDNYACEDFNKRNCSVLIATPTEAFQKMFEPKSSPGSVISDDFLGLLRRLPEMREYSLLFDTIEALKAAIKDTHKDVVVRNIPMNVDPELENYFHKMGLQNKVYTAEEWRAVTENMAELFSSDKKVYRAGRRLSKLEVLAEKHNATIQSNNYDHNLQYTKVGKTFTETVRLLMDPLRKIPGFDRKFIEYGVSYMLLNILGMDDEKNQAVEFRSIQTDSQHSYYGTRMDFVVSNDKGFRSKSKALYNLYSIDTKVLSLDEFALECPLEDGRSESVVAFLDTLEYDLTSSLLVGTRDSLRSNIRQQQFKLLHRYFSYFNMMEVSTDDNLRVICLWNKRRNVNDFVSFKEVSSVVSKTYATFGVDDNGRCDVTQDDHEGMRLPDWHARKWSYSKFTIELKYIDESAKLVLQVQW